jgi:transposase
MRSAYLTDLSDTEWAYLEAHLPAPQPYGRSRTHSPREILNAIFYNVHSRCAWRLLPHDFPPWKTVYHYFRAWRLDGTWEWMHRALRERVRVRVGRNPQPKRWDRSFFRDCIKDDVYKPHGFEEVEAVVFPEVATRLEAGKRYGIWWFNRRGLRIKQVSEPSEGGRRYRKTYS